MLGSFWSGLGGELAKQWATRTLTAAFVYWAAGLALVWWSVHSAAVHAHGLVREIKSSAEPVSQLPAVGQGLLIVTALIVVAGSALIAERLTLPVLRLLEGHWRRPRRLRKWLVARRRARRALSASHVGRLGLRQRRGDLTIPEYLELRRLEATPNRDPEATRRLRELEQRRTEAFTAQEAVELARWQRALREMPRDDALAMPTRLGDMIRAAQQRPFEKYGLDSGVSWPALLQVLPEDARAAMDRATSTLNSAVRSWLWAMLFLAWTPWTIWAMPLSIAMATLIYYVAILGAASVYGDTLGVIYDIHRMRLYDSLHLPRPASPAEERALGLQTTNLLWGGLDDPKVRYVAPSDVA